MISCLHAFLMINCKSTLPATAIVAVCKGQKYFTPKYYAVGGDSLQDGMIDVLGGRTRSPTMQVASI